MASPVNNSHARCSNSKIQSVRGKPNYKKPQESLTMDPVVVMFTNQPDIMAFVAANVILATQR